MSIEASNGPIFKSQRSSSYGTNYKRSFNRLLRETSVRILFSPLDKTHKPRDEKSDDRKEVGYLKIREADYLEKRQMFLTSYQFTLEKTVAQKLKASFVKVKVMAKRIMGCKLGDHLVSGLKRFGRIQNRLIGC
ncbi:hypothetical protein SUGI_0343050 [Cryptomeria japonica]|nr:hypothetical protein SUGI_0343050 [Cryptomeria japonica]